MTLKLRPILTAAWIATATVAGATGPALAGRAPGGGPGGAPGGESFRPPGQPAWQRPGPPSDGRPGPPPRNDDDGDDDGHRRRPEGREHDRDDDDGPGPPGMGFRPFAADNGTSLAPGAIRRAAMEELREVPLLEGKVRAMITLQQDRRRLQDEKRRAAANARMGGDPRNLGRFHEVVRMEDELTSRQQRLLAETLRDGPAIRSQISVRRRVVSARLAALEAAASAADPFATPAGGAAAGRPPSGPFSPEAIELRWTRRLNFVYEALEERLAVLESNPRQPDWARPFLRILLNPNGFGPPEGGQPPPPPRPEDDMGGPPPGGNPPPPHENEMHQRLDALSRDRDELARKLERMERRMEEMQRRGGGGGPPPATPPPR